MLVYKFFKAIYDKGYEFTMQVSHVFLLSAWVPDTSPSESPVGDSEEEEATETGEAERRILVLLRSAISYCFLK